MLWWSTAEDSEARRRIASNCHDFWYPASSDSLTPRQPICMARKAGLVGPTRRSFCVVGEDISS